MKTLNLKLILLLNVLIFSTFLLSCGDDDNGMHDDDFVDIPLGTIQFDLDNEFVVYTNTTTFLSEFGFNIEGEDSDGTSIVIGSTIQNLMEGTYQIGTVDVAEDSTVFLGTYAEVDTEDPLNSNFWISTEEVPFGEMIISELTDNTVKGSFFFTGKNNQDQSTKEITNGLFYLELPN